MAYESLEVLDLYISDLRGANRTLAKENERLLAQVRELMRELEVLKNTEIIADIRPQPPAGSSLTP